MLQYGHNMYWQVTTLKLRFAIVGGLIVVIAVFFVLFQLGGKGKIADAKNWPIEDFTYTDHNGEPFSLEDLKGKIWIADFIFTNCETVCLPMTYNMVKLQTLVKEEGLNNVEFVSFSVDPENDTPEVLRQFGEQFQVDFSNYHFLTGYSQEEIEAFAQKNFKQFVKKPDNDDQVIHQIYFYLVDQNGVIMKLYPGTNDIPFVEIIEDIKKLQ